MLHFLCNMIHKYNVYVIVFVLCLIKRAKREGGDMLHDERQTYIYMQRPNVKIHLILTYISIHTSMYVYNIYIYIICIEHICIA